MLAVLVALSLAGCLDSTGEQSRGSSHRGVGIATAESPGVRDAKPDSEGNRNIETRRPITGPSQVGPRKHPAVTVGGPRSTEPNTEKIPGYAVPAEYFVMSSRHYPNAVAAVMLPHDYGSNPDKKYPLVIAFGGAGECARSPRDGALAWMHYYKSDEAARTLPAGKLESRDFRGLVKQTELEEFNRRLHARKYSGVILACPYSPLLSPQVSLEFPEYEAFIVEELIPALEKNYRVAEDSIGVDGVSMGGARSMYYGFKYPQIFRSVGSVQGAFGPYMGVYRGLLEKNRDAIKQRAVQLVTSDGDVMAPSVEKLHQLLAANAIPHSYRKMTGPHDYIFNQGPGALALLVFHGQALSKAADR